MSELIMFNVMSVEGFMAGADDDISWHRVDEAFSIEQLRSVGGLVFGRRTYEMMAEFWPNEG